MNENQHYLSNCNITMSNALVRSGHGLTLQEKRIICACIAQIDSRKGNKRDAHLSAIGKEMKFKITVQDYNALFDVDLKNCYNILKNSAKSLLNRQFSMTEKVNGKERVIEYNWLGFAIYAEEEGFIELAFSKYAYPHLNALKNQLTTYKLKNAQAYRSTYTWRIYELIMQFKQKKELLITVEHLRIALDVPHSYRWQEIRIKAIQVAIKELKKKSGIILNYTTFKTGRKITSLKFTWDNTQ